MMVGQRKLSYSAFGKLFDHTLWVLFPIFILWIQKTTGLPVDECFIQNYHREAE